MGLRLRTSPIPRLIESVPGRFLRPDLSIMNWKSLLASLLAAVFLLGFTTPQAQAQLPKVGDYYTDDSDLGFRLKMPKDWAFIPPQPGEINLIGKYNHPHPTPIPLGRSAFYLQSWLVKFDRREKVKKKLKLEDEDGETVDEVDLTDMFSHGDILEWAQSTLPGTNWEIDSQKEMKISKIPAVEYQLIGDSRVDPDEKMRAYAMVYMLNPDCEVAVVFNGPGDKSKWKSKYLKVYSKMAKSFKTVKIEKAEISDEIMGADDTPMRAKKRAELLDYVRRTPGWELHETQNYFIISHINEKRFIKDMKERLEAIRAVYMVDYPPEMAQKARDARAAEEGLDEPDPDGEGDGPGIEFTDGERSSTGEVDPMELARTSVVRVCATPDEYNSYGGPGGSAGYWSSYHKELVIYWDPSGGGRDTWLVLNHEAFHQFIYYFYGQLSPHSWYNEGTGDFYSGYKYKNKKFTLKEAEWRRATAMEMIKTGEYVPLEEMVRYTQSEYYGNNDYGLGGGKLYAEGWSFIYFLRTGQKKAKGWNDDWDSILDTYLEVLAETEDLDQAVDVAFDGVDWKEMETVWKKYMG